MKLKRIFFSNKKQSSGNILVELLLTVALTVVVIPFIFQYHQDAIKRTENILITEQMSLIKIALEKHISEHREELLKTIGRNITRVNLQDLAEYGLPDAIIEQGPDKYQLRILKTSDSINGATLQGVIVRVSDEISPMRTREIVNLSGGTMGFIDGTHAYGTFGAWHTDTVDLGINLKNGIVETTNINNNNALYLWREKTDNPNDATMMSALNLAGHDILNTHELNAQTADFTENISSLEIATSNLIFQNRTTIDAKYTSKTAVVSGMMSSDSKDMEVRGIFSLADTAKLSSLTTENLWVSNLTLSGLSINTEDGIATLKINQSMDMTSGHIEAMFVSVGFTGSVTPRLIVYNRIEDSINPSYYWDVESKTANFLDASFVELNRMATLAHISEGDKKTYSSKIFGSVSANKNATVADFMNAISQIQNNVRAKYQNLQLQ